MQAIGLGRKGTIEPFDLDVYAGEVVGLAGLLGSGRTELARLLYGADHADSGEIRVEGGPTKTADPAHRPGARHRVLLGEPQDRGHRRRPDRAREHRARPPGRPRLAAPRSRGASPTRSSNRYIEALGIRPANPEAIAGNLSGGNQQKVLLARWLATAPKLLLLDEPTRGIDVGAKAEIQKLVADLAAQGMAVVFISAELEEVLRLSHRIAVLRDRRKVAEITNSDDVTTDDVVHLIASGGQS